MKSLGFEMVSAIGHAFFELSAAYFWLRGLWRNNRTDRLFGCLLLVGLGCVGVVCGQSVAGFNLAGGWFLVLGLITLVVSPIVHWRGRSTGYAGETAYVMLLAGVVFSL